MKRRLFLFAAPAIITTPGLLMAIKPLPFVYQSPVTPLPEMKWGEPMTATELLRLQDQWIMSVTRKVAEIMGRDADNPGFRLVINRPLPTHIAPIAQPSAA